MITLVTESNIYDNYGSYLPPSLPAHGVASICGYLRANHLKYNLFDFYPHFLKFTLKDNLGYTIELCKKYRELLNVNRYNDTPIDNLLYQTYLLIKSKNIKTFLSDKDIAQISNIIRILYQLYKADCRSERSVFLRKTADMILSYDNPYIGFSIQNLSNTLYTSLLNYVSKRGRRVIIGGQFTFNIKDREAIVNIYKTFPGISYIILGYGEIPLLSLLNRERDSSVISTKQLKGDSTRRIKINYLPPPKFYADFSHYDIDRYFSPVRILPISLSRGCYWKRCIFCRRDVFRTEYITYKIEDISDYLLKQNKKHNVTHFLFCDEALSLKRALELSIYLHKQKINSFKFCGASRSDIPFSIEEFKRLYRGGFRSLFWGIESGSQKVLNIIKKGTNVRTNYNNLKNSFLAGLSNLCFYIYGLPFEKEEEFIKTISFIKKTRTYVDYFRLNRFILQEGTYMFDHLSKYNISNLHTNRYQEGCYLFCSTEDLSYLEKYRSFIKNKEKYFSGRLTTYKSASEGDELLPLLFVQKSVLD